MATAGLTAAIADEVPDEQRGAISAAIYGPQAVGILVGVGVLTALNNNGVWGYLFLAVALVACATPFIRRYRDVATTGETLPLSLRSIADGMWIDPRANPDFAWAFGGRLLVNLGNAFGTTYQLAQLTGEQLPVVGLHCVITLDRPRVELVHQPDAGVLAPERQVTIDDHFLDVRLGRAHRGDLLPARVGLDKHVLHQVLGE